MFDQLLNNPSILVMKKLQDYTMVKQKVIANNIANVETPGFKAKDVSFKAAFEHALQNGDVMGAMQVQSEVFERNDAPLRNDGNNVDLEKEMIDLQKNKMRFDVYTEILRNRYKLVKDLFAELKA